MEAIRERARELCLKYRLVHYVQGDDGFGGEDEPDSRAMEAIGEALAQSVNTHGLLVEFFRTFGELQARLYPPFVGRESIPEDPNAPIKRMHRCNACKQYAIGPKARVVHIVNCPLGRLEAIRRELKDAAPHLFVRFKPVHVHTWVERINEETGKSYATCDGCSEIREEVNNAASVPLVQPEL